MKKIYIIPMLIGAITIGSCKKTLDTLPKNSVDASQVVTQGAGVEAILNSAYETMQVAAYYGRDLIVVPELLSDNMRIVSTNSNRFVNESNNAIAATINIWQNAYLIINKCNGAIKYVDLVSDLSAARKKQVKAEALFLRAMAYFDLVKSYAYNPRFVVAAQDRGGVPIVLDYVQNYPGDIKYPKRAPTADVYTQIKNDLTTAIGLFPAISAATVTTAPKRGNIAAAYGLLSRVNLYLGEWQACYDNATLALGSGLGTFVDPGVAATAQQKSDAYKSIWNSGTAVSPESLFELNYEATETLGSDCLASIYTRYTFGGIPTTGGSGYGDAAPQANLVAAYEAGDVRKDLLFPIVKGGESILWNQKYPAQKYASVDNIKLIRVSEIYLNRAEAGVKLGGAALAQAQLDLNKIRQRANLGTVTATFASVFAERRIELAYEGQRWFDLLRTGSDINKSSTTLPANATPTSTLAFTDFKVLAKIPTTEVTNNTNLVNNYNY